MQEGIQQHEMRLAARRRRHRLLLECIASMGDSLTILDVGGTLEYWNEVGLPRSFRSIVLLNTFHQAATAPFESVVGDARDLSRYESRTFDLVFSNSVIGHVGTADDQMRMAAEIRRVGRHFFLQTPNHGFPVDWRTLVPFFHFLSPGAQAWCLQRFRVGRYQRVSAPEDARLLATRVRNVRRRELGALFPGGRVVDERILGFTKSFMIHDFAP